MWLQCCVGIFFFLRLFFSIWNRKLEKLTEGIGDNSPNRNTVGKRMVQSIVEHKVNRNFPLYSVSYKSWSSAVCAREVIAGFQHSEFRRQQLSYEDVKLPMIWMHRSLRTCCSEFCDHLSSRSVSHLNLCIIQFKRAYWNVSRALWLKAESVPECSLK